MGHGIGTMGSGAGRSGSFFFCTNDRRFILKSISKTETTTLMHLLQSYESHVTANVNTLLTRFFGLYTMKVSGKKCRFVVVKNQV